MKKPPDDVTQFHSVDQTTNPTFFMQFMDASHALPTAQSYKQEMMDPTQYVTEVQYPVARQGMERRIS